MKGLIFTREDFERLATSKHKCWLINIRAKDRDQDNLTRYLEYVKKTLAKNKLSFTIYSPAEIIVPCFMYRRARFIYNEAKVYALNSFQLIYIKASDSKYIKAIVAYLNSSYVQKILRVISVKYSETLYKIEPRHLKALPLPKLDDELVGELADLFERLKASGKDEQLAIINEIDETLEGKVNLRL